MIWWQTIILIFIALYSTVAFFQGFKNTYIKKNPYGLTPRFNILGSFVWVDAVVFGAFFSIVSVVSILFQNINLFLLVFCVFWVIRSVGEQIYWFLEQFADKNRNKPENLPMSKYFPGKSVYIYTQIFWQCISVIAIILSVYFFLQVFK